MVNVLDFLNSYHCLKFKETYLDILTENFFQAALEIKIQLISKQI